MESNNCIKVWVFENAPEEFKFIREDVDVIAFVPNELKETYFMFLDHLSIWVNEFEVDGGIVYIGTHA